jgi:2,3-bisphosphoglycerate-dependent phosphoglycerate mutase
MTHLYLIRHADYIYDLVDGKYPKRDLGLSPEGTKQAERLRERLVNTGEIQPDVFISSPQRGARETAEIVAPALGKLIVFDKDVAEWRNDDGSLSTEEFMSDWEKLSDAQRPYYRWVEGGENMMEFSLRVHLALNRIIENHQGKTIILLSHGVFIQVSFAYFFGYNMAILPRAAPKITKTSITHWFKADHQNKWILERSNDYHHLC